MQNLRDIRLLPSQAQELAYNGGWYPAYASKRTLPAAWQWRDFNYNDYFHVTGRGVENIMGMN